MSQPPAPAEGVRPGLRERKKAKTRAAIQEHALRLFREQGYAATTVEQVADAAEVSPSTFFRYFPTKEDVVMYDAIDPLLIEAFRSQPPTLTVLEALRVAMRDVFSSLDSAQVEDQLERGRLALREPDLQAAYVSDMLRSARLMSELLAERTGRSPDDPEIRMYVGAVGGALLAAMVPLVSGESADFIAAFDRVFKYLESGFRL
jgi:AcrR family transcriptional regulator